MQPVRELEAEFKVSLQGQARAAKAAGQRYFQVMLSVNAPYQVWSDKISVDHERTKDFGDQGAVLSDIAE